MAKQDKQAPTEGNEIKTAADLIQDEHNYRKHSDTNKARIKKSIDEAGLGRSVVIDADGVLVAGNGVQQVIDKDTPVRVVETDGTELVVVKRTDLHTDDPRRKTLALADNATADDVEWDFDAIADDWTEDEAGEWGVVECKDDGDGSGEGNGEKNGGNYSRKIEVPVYTPTGEDIPVGSLTNTEKYDELVAEIDASGIDSEVADFLKAAAARHIVFDYARIGDYYANATPEVQRLMERSALVIIDFEKAIENGFVKMSEELRKEYTEQLGGEQNG